MERLAKVINKPENLSSEEIRQIIHDLQVRLVDIEQKEEVQDKKNHIVKFNSRYSELYHFVPIGYFIIDRDGLIQDTNLAGAALLGSERSFLINTPLKRYIFWKDRAVYSEHILSLKKTHSQQSCEIRIMRPDGSRSYAQLESAAITDDKGNLKCYRIVICTEQRRDENSLEKLRRTYQIINKSRPILLRTDNETGLLENICRVIVDIGGYCMARVMVRMPEKHSLQIISQWGEKKEESPDIIVNTDNFCPASTAIETNSTIILKDILTTPAYKPWRSHAIYHGYSAFITLPLSADEKMIGALSIYAREPDSFGTEESNLLEVFAENLSHGINLLREKIKRRKIEKDLAKYHIHLEDMVRKRTEKLQAALKEKEILLREIHHRVKNNMQVISSLIGIQEDQIRDPQIKKMFRESQSRIMVMALIHENLYLSESLEQINLEQYIKRVAGALLHTYGADGKIILKIYIQNIFLGIDQAVPCGLIINELISNSLKYAFPKGEPGEISISAHIRDHNMIELFIKDNGCGFPDGVNLDTGDTLGFKLIKGLTENQLKGTVNIHKRNGICFHICFKTRKN